jgi:hypothetical protein
VRPLLLLPGRKGLTEFVLGTGLRLAHQFEA